MCADESQGMRIKMGWYLYQRKWRFLVSWTRIQSSIEGKASSGEAFRLVWIECKNLLCKLPWCLSWKGGKGCFMCVAGRWAQKQLSVSGAVVKKGMPVKAVLKSLSEDQMSSIQGFLCPWYFSRASTGSWSQPNIQVEYLSSTTFSLLQLL